MPGSSFSQSTSTGTSTSTSTPVQTPQSAWGLQLSHLLSALGSNQYQWAMNQFNKGMGITDENISQFMDMAGKGSGLAQTLLDQYENQFAPLMDEYIRQAGTYNSEGRQRFDAGQAESTVAQADQQARDEAERKLQGYGINPNSGRYQDLMLTSRIQDAAARAGAGTQASLNTANIGRQMTRDAAQMGQNVPGMAVNALQSAMTGVSGAENAILGMLNTGANLTQSAAPFYNAAASAIKNPSQATNSVSKNDGKSQSTSFQPQQAPQQSDPNKRGAQQQQPTANSRDPYSAANPLQQQQQHQGPTAQFQPNSGILHPNTGDREQPDSAQTQLDDGTGQQVTGGAPNQYDGAIPVDQAGALTEFGDPTLGKLNGDSPETADWQNPIPNYVPPQSQQSDIYNTGGQDYSQVDPWSNPFGQQQPQQASQDWGQQQDWNTGNQDVVNNYGDSSGWDQSAQQPDYSQSDWGSGNDSAGFGGGSSGGDGGWEDDTSDQPEQDGYDYEYYARGGDVRPRQQRGVLPTSGGPVNRNMSPSRGRQTDDVPARLNAGEFVVPRDVVAHKGSEFFHNLITKSRKFRTGMAGPPARPQMKPALRQQQRPNFVSRRMGA